MQKRQATASKEIGLSKPFLQHLATPRNRCQRIVAPKVAGSSPVGHPNLPHCDEVKGLPRGHSRLGANAAYRDTGQSGCPTCPWMSALRNWLLNGELG